MKHSMTTVTDGGGGGTDCLHFAIMMMKREPVIPIA